MLIWINHILPLKTAESNYAMEQAAKTNDVEEIKKLYKKDKNSVHKRGVWKWTPLMRAADNNRFEVTFLFFA